MTELNNWEQRLDEIWQDELIQGQFPTAPDFLKGWFSQELEKVQERADAEFEALYRAAKRDEAMSLLI